ncbi:hypothetical protein [Nocardia sp. NPDC049707]|uniref:hypothetical protein n=1 Tax=Nocardia sp. NPDC049707 TaxID=3154735 RepID=UPI003434E992
MRSNLTLGMRLLSTLGLAAILLLPAGCDLSSSDEKVIVEQESPALADAFERVRNSRGTARLGDIIIESGIPVGPWDRMYSFRSATAESINDRLGTEGLGWWGLPFASDSVIQVFVHNDKVVYAYSDRNPRYSVYKYATPESEVKAVQERLPGKTENDTYWTVEIEEFPK